MNKKRNERELPGNANAKQNGETVAEQEKAKNLTEQSAAETGLNNSEIRADGSIEADSSNESEKKQKKPRTKYASASYLAKMGLLSAAAALLLFIEFPIFPATPHLKLNVSDFPVLLASFIFGPISGIVVNAVKVGLCLLIRGTSTAFVGDISNLVSGTLYALSAGVIYMLKRDKTGAVLALVCGSLIFCLSMWVCNDLFLLPLFGITDKAAKLTMLWWTLLFNVIKTFLTSLITFYVYKKVRRLFDKF